ncbi:MAG: sulfurtransferase TusA family protein [Rhizomicrobium sp.]|jgi:tRNA 2-thiouridine synthesizing protein A
MNPLDLRGLKCPLPALFAKRALVRAGAGAIIEVIADDPMAPIDVPHMCRQEGFEVIETVTEKGVTRLTLKRPD